MTLELCAALVLVSLISTTPSAPADVPPPPIDADIVAADPGSFGAAAVKGHIIERPMRISERDRRAFVLAGPRGGRLLVVAARDAQLPYYREGVEVVVHGSVVVPPDSKRLRRQTTSRTAIAKRMHAPALIKATEVQLER
jgi:hypothetical protein